MSLTTIALHVQPGPPAAVQGCLALPSLIAEAHAAHLTALVFSSAAARDASAAEPASPTGEDAVAEHVAKTLAARGLRFEVRARDSFAYGVGEILADQMRVSDLGVMSFGPGVGPGRRFVASAGIFASGRPLLLVPSGHSTAAPPSRLILASHASPPAVRAVHGALPSIRRAAAVTVVSVTDDREFRPGQSGVEPTHLLARHRANATFHAVRRGRAGVARALQDVARQAGADMIVMGAVRHAPRHNLVFGSATTDPLAQGAALPALLAA